MIKKIFSITLVTVLTVVMLLAAITVVGLLFRDEKQLSPWGTGFFNVVSGSMAPAVPVGSIIFVNAVPAETIEVGDIIAYISISEDTVITHRVVDKVIQGGQYVFTTKGDGNRNTDPPMWYDRIIGRVFYIIPGNSSITKLFKNANNIGFTVILIGVAICGATVVGNLLKRKILSYNNQQGESVVPDGNLQPDEDVEEEHIQENSIREECIQGNKTLNGDNNQR